MNKMNRPSPLRSFFCHRGWPVAVLVLAGVVLWLDFNKQPVQTETDSTSKTGSDLLREIAVVSRSLSRDVGKSVVRVEVRREAHGERLTPTSDNLPLPATGQGSGIIVSNDGLILTNHHVVEGAASIRVSASGRHSAGTIVGTDVLTDLALLRVEEPLGEPVDWGDSNHVAVGDFIWAIGNPFGLQRSVTFGIVSALEQEGVSDNQFQDFFQTDAAVNPGNSGGPVVDSSGKVIGINTAIAGEVYRGISFAIPSNTARNVVQQLRVHGRVRRGWLGVNLANITDRKLAELGLPSKNGALVDSYADANATTPAKAAGIQVDDVIVDWNDSPVDSAGQLGRLIAQTGLGTVAKVRIWRQGRWLESEVTIGERP